MTAPQEPTRERDDGEEAGTERWEQLFDEFESNAPKEEWDYTKIPDMGAALEAACRRIADLERALRFYANRENYKCKWIKKYMRTQMPAVASDDGKRARRALGRKP